MKKNLTCIVCPIGCSLEVEIENNPNDEKLKLIAIQDLADKQRFYNSHILSGKMNVMGYSVQWGAPDGFMQY